MFYHKTLLFSFKIVKCIVAILYVHIITIIITIRTTTLISMNDNDPCVTFYDMVQLSRVHKMRSSTITITFPFILHQCTASKCDF